MRDQRSINFTTARAHVMLQHQDLHRLFLTANVLAGAAARGDRPCQEELPRLLEILLGKLDEHLAYEEEVLLPLIASEGGFEPASFAQLGDDHERQRHHLAQLVEKSRCLGDPVVVARDVGQLMRDLFADIAAEEQWLLGEAAGASAAERAS